MLPPSASVVRTVQGTSHIDVCVAGRLSPQAIPKLHPAPGLLTTSATAECLHSLVRVPCRRLCHSRRISWLPKVVRLCRVMCSASVPRAYSACNCAASTPMPAGQAPGEATVAALPCGPTRAHETCAAGSFFGCPRGGGPIWPNLRHTLCACSDRTTISSWAGTARVFSWTCGRTNVSATRTCAPHVG